MNYKELKDQQEKIAKQVKEAELAWTAEKNAAREKIKALYLYTVYKTDRFDSLANAVGAIYIRATRTETDETRAYAEKFGEPFTTMFGADKATQNSVWYAYYNGQIHHGGSGYIILATDESDGFSNKPIDATQDEWNSILANRIPARLLNSKYCTYQPAQ